MGLGFNNFETKSEIGAMATKMTVTLLDYGNTYVGIKQFHI